MSQQFQQPSIPQGQTSQQYQQPQYGGQQRFQGQPGQQFQQSVPNEVLQAVEQLEKVSTVAEWTHAQAMNRGRHDIAHVTKDIEELALVQKRLLLRQSPFAQTVSQCVTQTLQQGIQQLGQHADQPGVQDVLQQVQTTLPTIQRAVQWVGQQGQIGQQQMGQQGQMIQQQPQQQGFGMTR